MANMASVATVAALNPIEYAFMSINTNPYFIGLMMLLLNLGGRFIGMEVSKEQEKFFQQPWIRRALIFTVLFVATRNVFVAFIMTIVVLLVLSFLFNENSDLYLLTKEKDFRSFRCFYSNGLIISYEYDTKLYLNNKVYSKKIQFKKQ